MQNDSSIFTEEMFAQAELFGSTCSRYFRMNNRTIDIKTLESDDETWSMVKFSIDLKRGGLNLAFTVMLCHFPEKFDQENLNIFMNHGCNEVGAMAKRISNQLSAGYDLQKICRLADDLFSELDAKSALN